MHFTTTLFLLLASQLASAVYVVSGVKGGVNAATRQRPFRQDITRFAQSGPAWDLFVQSVAAVQNRSQNDPLSWFGFAGIHGRPFQVWDGVQAAPGQSNSGYATHNSILFGPWHRVFLAAYEQLIWAEAQAIAARYSRSQKQTYQNAATSLRIPYWDWANSATMPNVITDDRITVNTPKGQQWIPNPLSSYVFRPHPSEQQFPASDVVSLYPKTVRQPDNNGNSQISMANALLNQNAENIKDRMYLLLAKGTNYGAFSNTGYPEEKRNGSYDSVEAIHNEVHALVGGIGHMAYIPYSSFDPIFFMHHANVDRMLAIFSAINPSSYVVPLASTYGTFTEAPGTIENIHTALTPFHKDRAGNFHTSATARDTNSFGYTYPEVVDWNVTPKQLAANVRAAVNALYDTQGPIKKRNLPNARISSRIMARQSTNSTISNSTSSTPHEPREWLINLSVERDQAKPFFVHFFLGAPPADASQWKLADNLIVSQAVLSDVMSGQADRTIPAISSIPLTRTLVKVNQDTANVDRTVAFLKANLQWRLQGADGSLWPDKDVPNLKVAVVDQVVEINDKDSEFHNYGPVNAHPELRWGN